MPQANNAVLWRFQLDIGYQQQVYLVPQFDGLDIRTLFVEQEGGDIHGNLRMPVSYTHLDVYKRQEKHSQPAMNRFFTRPRVRVSQ